MTMVALGASGDVPQDQESLDGLRSFWEGATCPWSPQLWVSHLFVHEHVDDGVVEGGALGEEGRHCHQRGREVGALVGEDPERHHGVGRPGQHEAQHHQDHHPCHLLLCLLGRGRLLLLGSCLCTQRVVRGSSPPPTHIPQSSSSHPPVPSVPSGRYLADFANEAPVGEEDDDHGDDEVDDEHVEHVGLVVEVGVVGVVVGPTGALHPLRDVPGREKGRNLLQDPPWGWNSLRMGDAGRVVQVVGVRSVSACCDTPSHRNGTFISLLQGQALPCWVPPALPAGMEGSRGCWGSWSSPGPAEERRGGAGNGHDPGEGDAHHGVAGREAEVAHGLADDNVALDGQDNQGPQGNLACGEERESPWSGQSPSGLHLPLVLPEKSRGSWGSAWDKQHPAGKLGMLHPERAGAVGAEGF